MRCILLIVFSFLCLPVSAATIVASVEPLSMALRQLYGDQAEVITLLAPNQNPHHLSLSPRQVLAVRDADLVVWLGEEAEPPVAALIRRRSGPSLALAELPGADLREGDGHDHHDHDHDHDHGAHDHGHIDPHLWLAPTNLGLLASALAGQKQVPLPSGQPERFLNELKQAERTIAGQLAPLRQRPWLTYHHPFAYFQAHFDLADPLVVSEQLGAGPSSRRFVTLAAQIRESGMECALLEPEAQAALIRRLCPDCQRVELDPLGRDATTLGYSDWLEKVVAPAFVSCLQQEQ